MVAALPLFEVDLAGGLSFDSGATLAYPDIAAPARRTVSDSQCHRLDRLRHRGGKPLDRDMDCAAVRSYLRCPALGESAETAPFNLAYCAIRRPTRRRRRMRSSPSSASISTFRPCLRLSQ